MAKFKATIDGVKFDREGEAIIRLRVPKIEIQSVLTVAQYTEIVVDAEIMPEGGN